MICTIPLHYPLIIKKTPNFNIYTCNYVPEGKSSATPFLIWFWLWMTTWHMLSSQLAYMYVSPPLSKKLPKSAERYFGTQPPGGVFDLYFDYECFLFNGGSHTQQASTSLMFKYSLSTIKRVGEDEQVNEF